MDYIIKKHDDEKRLIKTITLEGLDTFNTKGGNVKIAASDGNIKQLVGCLEPNSRLVHTIFNTSLPVVLRRLPDGWKGTLEEAIAEVNAGTTKTPSEVATITNIINAIKDLPKKNHKPVVEAFGYSGYSLEDLQERLKVLNGETVEDDETTETE